MTERRIVSFAHCAVAIECEGARATNIVEFLFGDAPSDERIAPHVRFRVAPGSAAETLAIYRGDTLVYESDSDADLAEYLLGDVTVQLADKSRGGLVFHAGALAWHGRGVLVPGAIGVGKTTLTAWLVTKDLDYLTDEMVWVPEGTDSIHAFTRPLNVKKPSRLALQDVFDFEKHAAHVFSSAGIDLIPPEVLRPDNTLSAPPLGVIVFPHYQPDGESQIQPLTKAQAGFALLQTLVNARNLPELGFPEATRLAQVAPAYRIRYSHLRQIQEQVEHLVKNIDLQRNP
jgi:hypothetical protein